MSKIMPQVGHGFIVSFSPESLYPIVVLGFLFVPFLSDIPDVVVVHPCVVGYAPVAPGGVGCIAYASLP